MSEFELYDEKAKKLFKQTFDKLRAEKGLYGAKRIAQRETMLMLCERAESIDDLKGLVSILIKREFGL